MQNVVLTTKSKACKNIISSNRSLYYKSNNIESKCIPSRWEKNSVIKYKLRILQFSYLSLTKQKSQFITKASMLSLHVKRSSLGFEETTPLLPLEDDLDCARHVSILMRAHITCTRSSTNQIRLFVFTPFT